MLPPISELTEGVIEVDRLTESATRGSSAYAFGGVVSFVGLVRNHDHGREVASLTYEAHPSAAQVLRTLTSETHIRHPQAMLAVAHRVGDVPLGEVAFAVVAVAPHRAEAFDACRDAVETVKTKLPVWKHQVFADGTQEWVNCA